MKKELHGEETQDVVLEQNVIEEIIDAFQIINKHLNTNEAEVLVEEDVYEKVSMPRLIGQAEDILRSYINGERKSPEKIKAIREGMLKGDLAYDAISPKDYLVTMQFTADELLEIVSHNIEAVKFFRENDNENENEILSPQVIKKWHLGENKDKLLSIIAHNAEAQIIFEDNRVLSNADVDELKSIDRLVELYLEKVDAKEKYENASTDAERERAKVELDKCITRFTDFKTIFVRLVIDGKTDDEKDQIGEEIIGTDLDGRLLDQELGQELYELGLITCANYIDVTGNNNLKEMIENGKIKPIDVRRMFDRKSISIKDLQEIISQSKMEIGEKINLIFSTFPNLNQEDSEHRSTLMEPIANLVEGSKRGKGSNTRGQSSRVQGESNLQLSNISTYNSTYKWLFLSKLDPNFSVNYYPRDGHAAFYLPHYGCYIIEKLYDPSSKNVLKNAYGSATYIISEEEYEAQKSSLIVHDENSENARRNTISIASNKEDDLKVDRTVLTRLRAEGKVIKIIHKSWADSICKCFKIDEPESDKKGDSVKGRKKLGEQPAVPTPIIKPYKHTQEEAVEIRKLAEQVEKSKRIEGDR